MKASLRWLALAGCLACVLPAVRAAGAPFTFELLCQRAQAIAAQAHLRKAGEVPSWLRQIGYDELRRIEFNGPQSLWHELGLPFQVQFMHPGFVHDRTVTIAEVSAGRARVLPFRREYFTYRLERVGELPPNLGFAGFRLMFPLSGPEQPLEELGSFVGASYFRLLCRGAAYGLSARGLAIDTAEPQPEEFPAFTEFWLERPAADARGITVYALLESESVAGAYRLFITPGAATSVAVKAEVFCRRNPKVFGVAPLTSMFWRGENTGGVLEDYRPEVHDSDGLLLHTGRGEWIWRPLDNPRRVRAASFADESPRGFGLLQRDRDFEHYQDLEANYHSRPSAWIEPIGDWKRGAVRLVELPTKDEYNDNIVAFWQPERLPEPGQPIELEYTLRWGLDGIAPPAGFVRATRHGKTASYEPGLERFVVDFDGGALHALDAAAVLEPVVWIGDGATLHHATIQKNRFNGTWRVAFTIRPDGSGHPVEMRCFVRRGEEALTETWSNLWEP